MVLAALADFGVASELEAFGDLPVLAPEFIGVPEDDPEEDPDLLPRALGDSTSYSSMSLRTLLYSSAE